MSKVPADLRALNEKISQISLQMDANFKIVLHKLSALETRIATLETASKVLE